MPGVATEDRREITHIKYVCSAIHDFGDDLYEDLMDRDYEQAKIKAQKLVKELNDLIISMSDEV
tara:strand:- start:527 stop:718 length:192 start_codon:yes stop_codon:yes gene_type:complete